MSTSFHELAPQHIAFIEKQPIFFTASAAAGTRINCSPKPACDLRVLSPNGVAYLDLTGSGNETAAHLLADGRLTIMFCSFEKEPAILRLYGSGRSLTRGSDAYAALLRDAFRGEEAPGARQIVVLDIESVQKSCGFGVPYFEYAGDRPTLRRWAETKGEAELERYRREKNARSIDGLPTAT
jgi:hypothetical protein